MIKKITKKYPTYKKIIMIRDLRDVVVSYIHWLTYHPLPKGMGMPEDLNERLLWIIEGAKKPWYSSSATNIHRQALVALEWMQDPEVLVVRFEDLCGKKGGGSEHRQRKCIQKICNHLGVSISRKKMDFVVHELWGESKNTLANKRGSFRKGKTGSWKTEFSSEHKAAFKKRFGQLLIDMGYEEDTSW